MSEGATFTLQQIMSKAKAGTTPKEIKHAALVAKLLAFLTEEGVENVKMNQALSYAVAVTVSNFAGMIHALEEEKLKQETIGAVFIDIGDQQAN